MNLCPDGGVSREVAKSQRSGSSHAKPRGRKDGDSFTQSRKVAKMGSSHAKPQIR